MHWEEYLVLKPNEPGRPIFVNFEEEHGSKGIIEISGQGFQSPIHEHGRSDIGLTLMQFSGVNAPCNICNENNNNIFFHNGDPGAVEEGYYDNISMLIDGMREVKSGVSFTFNNLGILTYTGTQPLMLPIICNHEPMPDNLALKLGYIPTIDEGSDVTEISHPTKDNVFFECMVIMPGQKAAKPGDIFGPVSDILVTCKQAINTAESGTILGCIPLSALPSRSYICHTPNLLQRPLQYQPYYKRIELELHDRAGRPLHLATGVPSAILMISHL